MISTEELTTTITNTILKDEVVDTAPTKQVDSTTTPEISILAENITGTVKWFNNNAGYGFITVCQGEYVGKDIFVHYSSICVINSQYKYLVQGEYVDFTLIKSDNHNHQYQATNVRGVKGGPIMCETRKTTHTHSYTRRPESTRYTNNSSSSSSSNIRPRRQYQDDSRRHSEERTRHNDGDYYESRTYRRRVEDSRDNTKENITHQVRRTQPSPEENERDREEYVQYEKKRGEEDPHEYVKVVRKIGRKVRRNEDW